MKLAEKVAFLQGLMNGLKIDNSTDEGKILNYMANILQELALSVEALNGELDEIVELVDNLDEDLGKVEEELYDIEEDYDYDCEDCDDNDEDFECDEEFYEVICPTCGDSICLTEDVIEKGSLNCPNCKELLEFNIDEDSE